MELGDGQDLSPDPYRLCNYPLSDFPKGFSKDGTMNAYLIVGARDMPIANLAATDFAVGFSRYYDVQISVGYVRLDSEDLTGKDGFPKNLIAVGLCGNNDILTNYLGLTRDACLQLAGENGGLIVGRTMAVQGREEPMYILGIAGSSGLGLRAAARGFFDKDGDDKLDRLSGYMILVTPDDNGHPLRMDRIDSCE